MISAVVSSSSSVSASSSASTSGDQSSFHHPTIVPTEIRERHYGSPSATNEHVHHHHHHHHNPNLVQHFHSQLVRHSDEPRQLHQQLHAMQPHIIVQHASPPRQPMSTHVEVPYARHPYYYYGPEVQPLPPQQPPITVEHLPINLALPPRSPPDPSTAAPLPSTPLPSTPFYWADDESDALPPVNEPGLRAFQPVYYNSQPYCPHYHALPLVRPNAGGRDISPGTLFEFRRDAGHGTTRIETYSRSAERPSVRSLGSGISVCLNWSLIWNNINRCFLNCSIIFKFVQ